MDEDKVQLKVYVKRGISDRFKRMVALKYQRAERGLISYEVEQALVSWLAMVGTQTQSTQGDLSNQRTNPIPVIHNLKHAICDYLLNTGRYDDVPQFIPHKLLVEAISAIKGTDIRTVKKWSKLLQQYGCLKQVGAAQWEIT